jgi:hypothetical protein
MRSSLISASAFLALGAFYWWLICRVLQVDEPWDAPEYWTFAYPVSLLLSALAGRLLERRGWLGGVAITFAQLPVMWANAGTGPLWPVGLIFLSLLSIPAMAVCALTGWISFRAKAGSGS